MMPPSGKRLTPPNPKPNQIIHPNLDSFQSLPLLSRKLSRNCSSSYDWPRTLVLRHNKSSAMKGILGIIVRLWWKSRLKSYMLSESLGKEKIPLIQFVSACAVLFYKNVWVDYMCVYRNVCVQKENVYFCCSYVSNESSHENNADYFIAIWDEN